MYSVLALSEDKKDRGRLYEGTAHIFSFSFFSFSRSIG